MIPTLPNLFSSGAKVKLLETLFLHSTPLPLRHLAQIADLPVRSVQLALEDFHRHRIVRRSRDGNRVLYRSNPEHPAWDLLSRVFREAAMFRVEARAKKDPVSGDSVLKFVASAQRLLRSAHRST